MDILDLIVPRWYLQAKRAGATAAELREQVQKRLMPDKDEDAIELTISIYEDAIASAKAEGA